MIQQQTETMWCYVSAGHWHAYPYGHPKAVHQRMVLGEMRPAQRKSYDYRLAFWLEMRVKRLAEREALDFRMVPVGEPVVDLYRVLSSEHRDWALEAVGRQEDIRTAFIPLRDIILTQEEVNLELVKWYKRNHWVYDPDGQMPLALRFYGDEQVYLINGHHRYARFKGGYKGDDLRMCLKVDHIDMSFAEACGKLEPYPIDLVSLSKLLVGAIA